MRRYHGWHVVHGDGGHLGEEGGWRRGGGRGRKVREGREVGEGRRIGSNVTGGSRKSLTNTGVVANALFASCL